MGQKRNMTSIIQIIQKFMWYKIKVVQKLKSYSFAPYFINFKKLLIHNDYTTILDSATP